MRRLDLTWPGWAVAVAIAGFLSGCTLGDDEEARPASSAEELIAFTSERDGDFDVYVMRPDGNGARPLTRDRGNGEDEVDDDHPDWSPDGTQLVFRSTRGHSGDSDEARDVYLIDRDGGTARRLTDNDVAEYSPRWSPDGDRIAFIRRQPSGTAIYTMRPDGTDVERLTEPEAALDVSLDWSPDVAQLVVTRLATGGGRRFAADVYTINAESGRETRLTDAPGVDGDAAWSPDGSKLVFVSDRDRNGRCFSHDCTGFATEIYVMNADGSGQRRVTRTTGFEVFPAWSPDGTRIAFARVRNAEDDYELFVVNADGTCERQLTENGAWDWMPSWTGAGEGPLQC